MTYILNIHHITKFFLLSFIVISIKATPLKASEQSSGLTGSDVSTSTYIPDQKIDNIQQANLIEPSKPEYLFEMEEDQHAAVTSGSHQTLAPNHPAHPAVKPAENFANTGPRRLTKNGSRSLRDFSTSPIIAAMLKPLATKK